MGIHDVWAAEEGGGNLDEGCYLAEIATSELKTSQAGNLMWNIKLVVAGSDKMLCFDRLMMSGSEKALGMTKSKLKALGFKEGTALEPTDLIGKRAYVAVRLGEPNQEGKRYLEVDIRYKGTRCGYAPESAPPIDMAASQPTAPKSDDVPW